MLRILSPLVRQEEVAPLLEAGADEFYCGLVHRSGALNDRPNNDQNNFSTPDELGRAVRLAKRAGKKIYLAINKPSLDLAPAVSQARLAVAIGMDGVIVSNLLLIKMLRDLRLKLELNASCLGAVFNSQSVAFFRGLGIRTFHLPRQLGLEHLQMIRQQHPRVRLSVFGLRGMCMNVEAFCLLHHLKKEYFIPCRNFRTVRVSGAAPVPKSVLDRKLNMPRFSCALCALRQLDEMGIYSIKIEGRNADCRDKVKHVSVIREALARGRSCASDEAFVQLGPKLFKEYFHATCQTEYCYY